MLLGWGELEALITYLIYISMFQEIRTFHKIMEKSRGIFVSPQIRETGAFQCIT